MLAWNALILTKQTITSCSVTEKFRKVNFRPIIEFEMIELCIQKIRSLIVLSTKVNNLPFWQLNDREREVGMVQAGMTHQAVADHFNVSRITISRLMIRLRQTGGTNDRHRNGRSRVMSERQDRHVCLIHLIHLRNRMITAEDTARRTDCLQKITWIWTPS
jgi:alpha-D-ribose 1-methylphosphonate 5-triphosphate synthase subunit PhnG